MQTLLEPPPLDANHESSTSAESASSRPGWWARVRGRVAGMLARSERPLPDEDFEKAFEILRVGRKKPLSGQKPLFPAWLKTALVAAAIAFGMGWAFALAWQVTRFGPFWLAGAVCTLLLYLLGYGIAVVPNLWSLRPSAVAYSGLASEAQRDRSTVAELADHFEVGVLKLLAAGAESRVEYLSKVPPGLLVLDGAVQAGARYWGLPEALPLWALHAFLAIVATYALLLLRCGICPLRADVGLLKLAAEVRATRGAEGATVQHTL